MAKALDAVGCRCDRLFWTGSYPPGSPTHREIPYAFKPYAFKAARDRGYDVAFWLDASIWPIKSVDYYFDLIRQDGHVLLTNVHNAWTVGQWCSDAALKTLDICREDALQMLDLSTGVVGLDFRHPRSTQFFEQWLALADDGITFPGAWTNKNHEVSSDDRVLGHRHDQTAASVISKRLGMRWLVGPETGLIYYDGRPLSEIDEHVRLLLQRRYLPPLQFIAARLRRSLQKWLPAGRLSGRPKGIAAKQS
jgi:hypothetical protein